MERRRWHPYYVILAGTTISAMAPFWMMITQYAAVIFFITQLSIGEITWSPMLATYSCWFAPEGEEGSFFALATVPVFAAKAAAGYMSGQVLKTYCPPQLNGTAVASLSGNVTGVSALDAPCSPVVWLIVGFVALSSPLSILACMKCLKIDNPEDGKVIELDDMTFSDIDVELLTTTEDN
jgi:hypothetical protein